ncbi:hypothetical protein TREPR_2057 [Treponema primitia ZAS-2]|uniref:Uncharacterized protein n=1 Tax=Treponema primitia (strain ATCC BAA-887 / DSM 12427 / ZAS-2) TaxID=545694 RepID=F5YJT0_TREPZ|nr:hypothetical protein TREPR_2057 [Treponema primitia ZAS-2]
MCGGLGMMAPVCEGPCGKDGGRWCPEKRSAGGSHRLMWALGGPELPHAV